MESQKLIDRRESRRAALNCPVRIIFNSNGEQCECDALLLDASERGARVLVRGEVGVGKVIEVIPQEGPDFAARGRVIWTAEFRARHETHLGIQFSEPHIVPSWRD